MTDTVIVDINAPQAAVAALYADPTKSVEWMDDLERVELISGEKGMPGSTFRLISKKGTMSFVATVVSRSLPHELRLRLGASNVVVGVRGTFSTLPDGRTRLVSEEEFRFRGLFRAIGQIFARSAIKKAHRHHMESFKVFAENAI